jgi:Zn-dependent M28 family amino/carboxypeptidase
MFFTCSRIDCINFNLGEIMGTPYIHTDQSAVETIKQYRNDNEYDTYHDALISMAQIMDDLDDDERSAYNHIMRNNALHLKLISIPKKQVVSWTVNLYWADGSVEERQDSPEPEYMNEWINDIEREVNNES